jgi:hypothetical protein
MLTLSMSWGFRALFITITVILGAGMFSLSVYSWFSILLFAISLLASVYNETWLFDKAAGSAEHRFGLLFLFKRKRIEIADIEELEIKRFVKGSVATGSAETRPGSGQAPDDTRGKEGSEQPERKKGILLPPFLFVELNLVLKSGESVNIETVKTRHFEFFKNKAEIVADFLEKPLELREKS